MTSVVIAATPAVLLRAGGRTILGRAVEMLRRADRAPDAVVCADALVDDVRAEAESWAVDCRIVPASDSAAVEGIVRGAREQLLLADGSVVFDPRLIDAAAAWTCATALVDTVPPTAHERARIGGTAFAGLAAIPRSTAAEALAQGRSILEAAELVDATVDVQLVDVETLPRYGRAIRREHRPFWIPVTGAGDLRRVRTTLASAAGKGHMEWYVVVLNRPVETFLSYFVAEWRITPNQITFISNVTAYAATALLALGHLWWAFGFIVVTGILDGLDGRQARIQIKTSKVGEWEHVFDAISELSWMAALTYFFYDVFGDTTYLLLGGAWVLAYAADNLSYTFYRLRKHMMIDEASPIDHAIRFVGSRRNTSFAYFFIALAAGYPVEGFWFVVGFAGLTAVVHWLRVAMLLSSK